MSPNTRPLSLRSIHGAGEGLCGCASEPLARNAGEGADPRITVRGEAGEGIPVPRDIYSHQDADALRSKPPDGDSEPNDVKAQF